MSSTVFAKLPAVSNVSVVTVDHADGADVVAEHAAISASWRRAMRRTSIFTLVDADPLGVVVAEWAKRLVGLPNDLELAIGLVNESTPVPDYYLVPIETEAPVVDWYLDLIMGLAPNRIVPFNDDRRSLLQALSRLPHGPELPAAPTIAAAARDYVPLPTPRTERWRADGDTSE